MDKLDRSGIAIHSSLIDLFLKSYHLRPAYTTGSWCGAAPCHYHNHHHHHRSLRKKRYAFHFFIYCAKLKVDKYLCHSFNKSKHSQCNDLRSSRKVFNYKGRHAYIHTQRSEYSPAGASTNTHAYMDTKIYDVTRYNRKKRVKSIPYEKVCGI